MRSGTWPSTTKRTSKIWRQVESTRRLPPDVRKWLCRSSPRRVPSFEDLPDLFCDVSLFLVTNYLGKCGSIRQGTALLVNCIKLLPVRMIGIPCVIR